jgi:hypothetical protein
MAIKTVGAKRLQGLKLDRVSDSLGSSATGVNTNVTIPNTVGEFTDPEGSNGNYLYNNRRYGVRLESGNSVIGETCTGLAFYLKNDSMPTSNFHFKVFRSSDGSGDADATWAEVGTTANIPTSELTGSFAWVEKDLASSVVLAEKDVVCAVAGGVGTGSGSTIRIGYDGTDSDIATANIKGAFRNHDTSDAFATTTETGEATIFKILGNPQKLGTGCYKLNGSTSKVVLGSPSDWAFL